LGHDGCPVCRCDGLYAKNFDLVDRINRKRVRCLANGCNWMGMLNEYAPHEHRRYSPYELDILISSYPKEPLIKFASGKDKEQEEITSEEQLGESIQPKLEQATVTEVNHERAEISTPVGLLPVTCEPVTTSLECTESNGPVQQDTPAGLHRLGRYAGTARNCTPVRTLIRRTHVRRNTTIGHTDPVISRESNVNRPATQNSQLRIPNRHSANTPTTMPNIPRPLVTSRTTRINPTTATPSADHISRTTTNPRQRRRSRHASRNSARRSVSPAVNSTQQRGGNVREIMSSTPNRWNSAALEQSIGGENNAIIELIPPTESTGSPLLPTPPPVISTSTPPSTTFLAARNQLFPVECRSEGEMHGHENPMTNSETTQEESIDRRNETCTLPAINPNATLTTGSTVRPSYEHHASVNEDRLSSEHPSNRSQHDYPDVPSRRPLEFRRLVPRRQGRVVEQLRETREQLAAMLRLMTMELEERRQHVIAATLETAARGRVLRNLNNQLSGRTDSESNELDTERESQSTTVERSSANSNPQNRQNHNHANSWSVLRNLPTPDRTTHQRQPFRLLRFTSGTDNTSTSPPETTVDEWTRRTVLGEPASRTNSESGRLVDSEHPPTDSSSNTRLLTRLRVGAITQPPAPPILLVSRRRNLSALLSDLRYANSTVYSGWSSDDEDET
uniref:RING-type domain-containing protein n=1 Tax=Echinostoma caproni TaxID=27848 RepID=A0A183AM06_9TREM